MPTSKIPKGYLGRLKSILNNSKEHWDCRSWRELANRIHRAGGNNTHAKFAKWASATELSRRITTISLRDLSEIDAKARTPEELWHYLEGGQRRVNRIKKEIELWQ